MTILPIKQLNKEKKEHDVRGSEQSHLGSSSRIHYIPTHISTNESIYLRCRPFQNNFIDGNPSTSLEHQNSYENEMQLVKRKSKVHRSNRKSKLQSIKFNSHFKTKDCDKDEVNSGDEYDTEVTDHDKFDELYAQFEKNLEEKSGFKISKMSEDGACLFRAVADQVYGDQDKHELVRKLCLDYMAKNSDYFSQFVTENFDKYVERKRQINSHGNHLEIQAMAEIYNRPMEVYEQQLEPINIFHGYNESSNIPIRLSYYKNMHYDSIVDPMKTTIGVGLGLPACYNGKVANQAQLSEILRSQETSEIEEAMFKDKLAVTDIEATNQLIEEQVARESYIQWLKDSGQFNTQATIPMSKDQFVLPKSISTSPSQRKNVNNLALHVDRSSDEKLYYTTAKAYNSYHPSGNENNPVPLLINNTKLNFHNSESNHTNHLQTPTFPLLNNDCDNTTPSSIDSNENSNLSSNYETNENNKELNKGAIVDIRESADDHSQPSTSFDSSNSTSIPASFKFSTKGDVDGKTAVQQGDVNKENTIQEIPFTATSNFSDIAPLTNFDDEQTQLITNYSHDLFGLNDSDTSDQDMIQALLISQQEYYEQLNVNKITLDSNE